MTSAKQTAALHGAPVHNTPVFDRLAKIIRVLSIPPVMVTALLIFLCFVRPSFFMSAWDLPVGLLTLALIPSLAYPLSYAIPSIRKKGRSGQRTLAIYCSVIGYLGGMLYVFLHGCSNALATIFLTYLFSVLILLVLNRGLKIRASGHACSVSGPIVILCLTVGSLGFVFGTLLWSLIFWASIRTRGHTVSEFLVGSCSPIVAYFLAALVFGFI